MSGGAGTSDRGLGRVIQRAMPAHWLIKSEPEVYPFARLEADRRTEWTGVRNFEARNNLGAMRVGDLCLYYHSVSEKSLVGVARVTRAAGRDPTAEDGDWPRSRWHRWSRSRGR